MRVSHHVKRSVCLLLSLLLLAQGMTLGAAAVGTDSVPAGTSVLEPAAYPDSEVLVLYEDGRTEVVVYEDAASLEEGLPQLARQEGVALVQPNYTYTSTALSTTDPLLAEQWALYNDGSFQLEEQENPYPVFNDPFALQALVQAGRLPDGYTMELQTSHTPYRWTLCYRAPASPAEEDLLNRRVEAAAPLLLALVDTGIDYTHADLEGRIWVNEDEIPGNGVDDDGNGYIDDVYGWNFYSGSNQVYTGSEDSHGTHGAGTIAAHADNGIGIAGIVRSDHVKVMAVKALGGWDGSGSTASIIRAIQYAEANGARICNLSLGSSRNDPALYRTIAASDMLFVVAAGNDGADLELAPSYPASYHLDNLITVANLRYDGNLDPTSSYGASSVDLAAPGTHILSTTPGNSYSYMTGTSMAAPMVSAAAAMLYSQFPDATLADVKDILLSSVQKLDSLTGLTATGGMLDLGAAMASGAAAQKGRTWTEPDLAAYTDSPPILSLSLFQWRGQQYLTVQVQDPDGDFRSAAYAAGTYTAANFQGGAAGTPLPLNAWGAATLLVRNGGPYTFYAVDLAGNETVRTVDLPRSP